MKADDPGVGGGSLEPTREWYAKRCSWLVDQFENVKLAMEVVEDENDRFSQRIQALEAEVATLRAEHEVDQAVIDLSGARAEAAEGALTQIRQQIESLIPTMGACLDNDQHDILVEAVRDLLGEQT